MVTAIDEKTALVLIDLQKGITGMVPKEYLDQLIQNANKLISAFHEKGLPVVMVNVKPGGKSAQTRKEVVRPASADSDDWADIIPDLKNNPDDIYITKNTWSAFQNPSLDEELQKRGITQIVIGGISTSIGVEGTARDAFAKGYNIAFAKDAMKDGAPEAEERSLKYIFPRMGEVDTTDNIIEKIKG
jgi:nicotinamidase-related amidase